MGPCYKVSEFADEEVRAQGAEEVGTSEQAKGRMDAARDQKEAPVETAVAAAQQLKGAVAAIRAGTARTQAAATAGSWAKAAARAQAATASNPGAKKWECFGCNRKFGAKRIWTGT